MAAGCFDVGWGLYSLNLKACCHHSSLVWVAHFCIFPFLLSSRFLIEEKAAFVFVFDFDSVSVSDRSFFSFVFRGLFYLEQIPD